MKIIKNLLAIAILLLAVVGCEKDECTKMVNLPTWDPLEKTFVDNYQEVPCDLGEPVDKPVNTSGE